MPQKQSHHGILLQPPLVPPGKRPGKRPGNHPGHRPDATYVSALGTFTDSTPATATETPLSTAPAET